MKKIFGQNFLRSSRYALSMAKIAGLNSEDTVLEIGPGAGQVTEVLLESAGKVVCVEVDYDLLPGLIKKFSENPKFNLIHNDMLDANVSELGLPEGYKVVASLPYNVSKKIIRNLISSTPKPKSITVIVQEEVARLYSNQAPKATMLGMVTSIYAKINKHESIPASQFYPAPKVNGAILHFQLNNEPENLSLEKLITNGFKNPRKNLKNNLANIYKITNWEDFVSKLKALPTVRAAELTLQQWQLALTYINEIKQASSQI